MYQTRPAPAFVIADGGRRPRLDRNERARLMFTAEALDRRTRRPRQHGGVLKRTGLAVLKALVFGFHNVATGRCDPGYDALARLAGVARSTVAMALKRLEAAGLVVRTRRQAGTVRFTNAYAFKASETAWSESRLQTTTRLLEQPRTARTGPTGDRVRALLGALEQRERRLGLAP
jgi:predicted transcriptional regulator